MSVSLQPDPPAAREGYVPAGHARLYFRVTGQGQPVVILHGGPDFDHTYLLPEMDRLAGSFRLIYYDQRGRGKSGENVLPEDVTLQSDVEDLDALRAYFKLVKVAILGHSWGGLLALEYALRHPDRVSHLILMNSAPAGRDDFLLFRQDRLQRAAADMEKLKASASDAKYQSGDPDTEAAYYRIHFRAALRQPEQLESVIRRLRASFTPEGILKARAIEDRLMKETWLASDYNLLPGLTGLHIPTLVLQGDQDFVPPECSAHIAQAIPGARLVMLKDCGHFAYLEQPDEVHREIESFMQ